MRGRDDDDDEYEDNLAEDEAGGADHAGGEREDTHIPVLAQEVLQWLDPQPGETYVDGTLGLGGHALLVSAALGAQGRIIGLDRDRNALERAGRRLEAAPCAVTLRHCRYSQMDKELASIGVPAVDRILLDIGVSSMQLDRAERGFSFMRDGPLDMRMDDTQPLTAEEIVMTWPQEELVRIFWEYGEERYSKKIAGFIADERLKLTINTTAHLAAVVERAVRRTGKIHPATRVFQALRIAVNDELGELERGLAAALRVLRPGGRLALITFHSLEDRLAKYRMREMAAAGLATLPHKKVIKPAYAESSVNRRARSAKLRILQKA